MCHVWGPKKPKKKKSNSDVTRQDDVVCWFVWAIKYDLGGKQKFPVAFKAPNGYVTVITAGPEKQRRRWRADHPILILTDEVWNSNFFYKEATYFFFLWPILRSPGSQASWIVAILVYNWHNYHYFWHPGNHYFSEFPFSHPQNERFGRVPCDAPFQVGKLNFFPQSMDNCKMECTVTYNLLFIYHSLTWL